jgi:plasmid replication initiation protein
MSYVIAFYELDRAYGGPEEGGWWFTTGQLVRVFRTAKTEDRAYEIARRANSLLDVLQKGKRPIDSMAYGGGRHGAIVFRKTAPEYFPKSRPHYE